MGVFSTPLFPESKNREVDASLAFDGKNQARVLAAGVVPEETGDSILVAPCSSGSELETQTGACATKQAEQLSASSASSASHPHDELEVGCNMGVTHGRDGLDSLVEASDMKFNDETGNCGITAADWLDVTHAMLCAIDGPIPHVGGVTRA